MTSATRTTDSASRPAVPHTPDPRPMPHTTTPLVSRPASRFASVALGAAVAFAAIALMPDVAHAAGAGGGAAMPWNSPLQNLLLALTGTTARILIALALVAGGFVWSFSRSEDGVKRIGQAIVGGAVVIGSASIVSGIGFVGATL